MIDFITEFLYGANVSIFDWLKNKSNFFSFCSLFLIMTMKENEKLPKQTPKEPPISLNEIMEIDFITEKIQQTKKRKQKLLRSEENTKKEEWKKHSSHCCQRPFLLMKRVSIWMRQSGGWTPWFFLNLKSDLILPWRNEFDLFVFSYCCQNKFSVRFFGNHWKNSKKWSFKLMNQNNVLESVLKTI